MVLPIDSSAPCPPCELFEEKVIHKYKSMSVVGHNWVRCGALIYDISYLNFIATGSAAVH
jgi:hypothetical protein